MVTRYFFGDDPMLHHTSFAVNNPLRAAEVVAELWQGRAIPFPYHEGSYIALKLDDYGSAIEFLPKTTMLTPGNAADAACEFSSVNPGTCAYTASHINIAVPISEARIYEIAAREGWRAVRCRRADFFDLVEFWIENEVLLELVTPPMMEEYLASVQPDRLQAMIEAAIASA
jgi:hypothetical protein